MSQIFRISNTRSPKEIGFITHDLFILFHLVIYFAISFKQHDSCNEIIAKINKGVRH